MGKKQLSKGGSEDNKEEEPEVTKVFNCY